MSDADKKEVQHIADGGSWCLDGRKERKLARLGYIETRPGQYGWYATEKGRQVLAPTPKEQDHES